MLLSAAGLAPAAAQVRPDTARADSIFRIDAIRVQTARAVTTAGGASALEVRIDSLGLAPVSTVADVLRELPLVQVRRNSRGEVQFSLRGSGTDSRQAAVLVDGVPLTLGWDARTDLSVIPTTAARSVTLTRGAPSVLYGPNALGGVVSIGVAVALDERTPAALELGSGIEHTGGYALAASATQPLELGAGRLVVRAGAGMREQPGLPRPDDVGAHRQLEPDYLLNSDAGQRDAFVGARFSADGGAWAALSAFGFDAERGVLPELHVGEPRLWRYPDLWRAVTAFSAGTGMRNAIGGGTADLEMSVGVDVGRTEIAAFESLEYDRVASTEIGDARTLSLRVLGDHTLGSSADVSAALTLADIAFDESLSGEPTSRYRQRLWSAALESTIRAGGVLGAQDLRITLGGVLDGADTPETGGRPPQDALSAWGARLGMTAVAANGRVLLHGALSRRARFPALRELYSGALGRFVPNPDLEPEKLAVGELGATVKLGSAELQAVGFMHRLSDAVVRISTPDDRFMRVNRDQMRSRGVELLALVPVGALHLAADLTLQRVELRDPQVPGSDGRAEYQPDVVAGLSANAVLPFDLAGTLQARYTGTQFCVNPELGGDQELEPWTRLDAQLGRTFDIGERGRLSRLDAGIAADNLLDAALYDQCGLPQPGRTLRLQVRIY